MSTNKLRTKRVNADADAPVSLIDLLSESDGLAEIQMKFLREMTKLESYCCCKCRDSVANIHCFCSCFLKEESSSFDENEATRFLIEVRNRRFGKTKEEFRRYAVDCVLNTITSATTERTTHCWLVAAHGKRIIHCRKEWSWLTGISEHMIALITCQHRKALDEPDVKPTIATTYAYSDTTYHNFSYDAAVAIFSRNCIPAGTVHILIEYNEYYG